MNLSRGMQATIEDIYIEPSPVSEQELTDAFQLAMAKIADLSSAEPQISFPPKRVKPIYLIAAILAMLALMGAGYALSQYFKKMYHPVETPSHYDMETDTPDALLHQAEFGDGARETIRLDDLGTSALESLFNRKTPGELLQFDIQTPEQKLDAKGIVGNGLNILYTISSNGAYGQNLLINRETAPSTQQVINSMIANGAFIATIDSPEYTPINYTHDLMPMIVYEDSVGTTLQLYFERTPESVGMPQDLYQNVKTEDFIANGHQFVYMDFGEFESLELYLGKASEFNTTKIGINLAKRGDLDTYKALANSLTLHNAGANAISIPDESFFSAIAHPEIQSAAAELAGIVVSSETGSEWANNGASFQAADSGKFFSISVKESFQKSSNLYPFGAHTPLVDQTWFPSEQLTDVSLMYDNMELLWITHSGNNYSFASKVVKNGYVRSPLDAVLASMDSDHRHKDIIAVIDPVSETPMVVLKAIGGDTVCIYSAVKLDNSRYLAQILEMPLVALPGDLLDR